MTDLQEGLRRLLGLDEVTVPVRLGGGSSQENYAFDAVMDGASRPLLLRRDPESGVVDTARDVEFALLRSLAGSGLPVPGVVAQDDGSIFGRPALVVERLPGRAHRGVLRDKDPLGLGPDGRTALAAELPGLLAAVHGIDPDRVAGILREPAGGDPAADQLGHWSAELQRVAPDPPAELRAALDWMEQHRPVPPDRIPLVHGDFRPANVLVDDGRVRALLDWELARLGDPHDDLGWYTCSIYRGEHVVPGAWETEDFLAAWTAATGIPVAPERLHFWQVLSVFRLAVIALTGVRAFRAGQAERMPPADRVVRAALAETGLLPE